MSTLPFTAPALLAPMEGITEACFRDLVLARNDASCLGGAFTEFVRVVDLPAPRHVLLRHLSPRDGGAGTSRPVGLQLMGADACAVAASAAAAAGAGAAVVDLNFGCPAKGALQGCAGSALLAEPRALERLVAACVRAVAGAAPVTAKIRAGIDGDDALEDLARAVEAGGASLLTIHCRTRTEGYRDDAADWRRIERAVAAVSIPVCGNGGVRTHEDLLRLRVSTGATFVMAGRAVLADPWLFAGIHATRRDALAFLREYRDGLLARGFPATGALARVKQLVHHLRAGGLFAQEDERRAWLELRDPATLDALLDEDSRSGSQGRAGRSFFA